MSNLLVSKGNKRTVSVGITVLFTLDFKGKIGSVIAAKTNNGHRVVRSAEKYFTFLVLLVTS